MDLLFQDFLTKPVWMWAAFLGLVAVLMALDLGVLHRKQREIGVRESLLMSAGYLTLGLVFGGWVWLTLGQQAGVEYLTGFVVEKSLAMDNIFVIAMIFSYFAVPRQFQHRVLFWGILGVIVLRAIMIAGGAALVSQFSWVLYLFAALLIATGVKMLAVAGKTHSVGDSRLLRWLERRLRVTDELHGDRFFVRLPTGGTGKAVTYVTPLFMALVAIEVADVIFAVDSVPAIFAITTDPYIIYTSNIFAILGLRALYFALVVIVHRFAYLKHALAVLLIFIGSKVFVADLMGWEKFPAGASLGVTFTILATGIVWSLWKTREAPAGPDIPIADTSTVREGTG